MKLLIMALISVSPLFAHADYYEKDKCAAQAERALARQGINDMTSVYYGVNMNNGEHDHILGYTYWYRRASCSGHTVVRMTRSCVVQSVYNRGGCR